MGAMSSKGKSSSHRAVKKLPKAQVDAIAASHDLVDPTHRYPTGPRRPNLPEINAQNPKATIRLTVATERVIRSRSKTRCWGLERVPETGPFIAACTHITAFDVFIPMLGMFNQGRRPRFMAKAEMTRWPFVGWALKTVGMQPVERHSGKARQIEEESIGILTSGRPLTVWPEGTLTRDPLKWPMTLKPGMAYIALEASRRLGFQVPLFPVVTWGAGSINQAFPWPRQNIVMCFDQALDYADLLSDQDQWGEEPPENAVTRLTNRVLLRMTDVESYIRGEQPPEAGIWNYKTMEREPRSDFEAMV